LVQLKLAQEQMVTHSEIFGNLFETAFNEDIFWPKHMQEMEVHASMMPLLKDRMTEPRDAKAHL
jgi:hypothetical protein